MFSSPFFRKTASALLHPLTLAAILLLLINDHILRRLWPTWITGKLGDFAWLFFFPLVVLTIQAVIIPPRFCRNKDRLALAAFGFVGCIFTLAKTVPACHRLLVQGLETMLQIPIGLHLDPTDLIALSALLAAWQLWKNAPELPALRLRWVVIVIPLCALLTIANSYDNRPVLVGFTDVGYHNGQAIICTRYAEAIVEVRFSEDGKIYPGLGDCYASADGGESWQLLEESLGEDIYAAIFPGQEDIPMGVVEIEDWAAISDPLRPDWLIRYKPGDAIETSQDGGRTWEVVYHSRGASQALEAYYRHLHPMAENITVVSGPRGVVADPGTGNIIFNMGYTGILIRQPDGSYHPVTVGGRGPNNPGALRLIWPLLAGEFWLSLLFGGLAITTLARLWNRRFDLNQLYTPLLLWGLWGLAVFYISPALTVDPTGIYPGVILLLLSVFFLPVGVEALMYLSRICGRKTVLRLVPVSIGCVLLFDLAFVLWTLDVLPNYHLAAGVGALLGAGLLAWQYGMMRPSPDQLALDRAIQSALPQEIRSRRSERIGFFFTLFSAILEWLAFKDNMPTFAVLLPTFGGLMVLAGVIQHGIAVLKGGMVKSEADQSSLLHRFAQRLAPHSRTIKITLLGLAGLIGIILWLPGLLASRPMPTEMARIPVGVYQIGDGKKVEVEAFDIEVYEVTNEQFARFLNATDEVFGAAHTYSEKGRWYAESEYAAHPAVGMRFYEARDYCEWLGARLPTADEWEVAARGGLVGKNYSWGDEDPVCTLGTYNGANFSGIGCPVNTLPVGSFAPNGYGLYDMTGNVQEWTGSSIDLGDAIDSVVTRGGSWIDTPYRLKMDEGLGMQKSHSELWLGFRCARSP